MKYCIVLSDLLLQEFYNFKHNRSANSAVMQNLLHYYKSHLTNVAQLKRIGIDNKPLMQQLMQAGYTNQTLEVLVSLTLFQVILHEDRDNYPYINIQNDKIENNFTSSYLKNVNRDKAHNYIKQLLKNANQIFIYDAYIGQNWNTTKKFFTDLVPKRPLTIYYADNHFTQVTKTNIKKICPEWKIKQDTSNGNYKELHDRYLIIDNKIEIILTSGFDYLFNESKDFTYIVKEKIL